MKQKNSVVCQLVGLLAITFVIHMFSMNESTINDVLETELIKQQEELAADQLWVTEELSKQRGLLIFLDDSEKDKFYAVSYALLTALSQEAGPIIVSTSLLYNILKRQKEDAGHIDTLMNSVHMGESIYLQITDPLFKKNIGDSLERQQNILFSIISFKQEEWIVKKIHKSLVLLLPKQYLNSVGIDSDEVKKYSKDSEVISSVELKLGLKVNHMETISVEQMNEPSSADSAHYFVDSLDAIFCKKIDYKNREMSIPEWVIFIGGHGALQHSIVHLSFDSFKKLLRFLDTKINTRLLVVKSCYAVGVHSNKIYGEVVLETQQEYGFSIIVQGINDVSVISENPTINWQAWVQDKVIKLTTHVDFLSFLEKAKGLEENYTAVIQPIIENFVENTPQIRLPGVGWFSVVEIDKKIVSIGSILAKTRDAQRPLDIVSFFKKDPEMILLYVQDIPFELIINATNLKAIISMGSSDNKSYPELVLHRIKKISSNQGFEQIIRWFFTGVHTEVKKFFIQEIDDKKDILILRANKNGMRVYFKDKDGFLYTILVLNPDSEIIFAKVDEDDDDAIDYGYEMDIIGKREQDGLFSEQIKKIENVLIKKRERQIYEAEK